MKVSIIKKQLLKPVVDLWYLLILYMILAFLLARILVVGSTMVADLTDAIFTGGQIYLESDLLPFLGLAFGGAIGAFCMKYVQGRFSIGAGTQVKNMITEHLVHLEYAYFDRTGSGSIMNKLAGDVFQMEVLFSEIIPEILMNSVLVVTVALHIFQMDKALLLVTLIAYPLLLTLAHLIASKMGELSGNRRELYDQLENTALDAYNGIVVSRTYNLDGIMNRRIDGVVNAILENEYTRTFVNSFTSVIGNLTKWIPLIICYLFAFYQVLGGKLTIGTLLAFVILLDRMVKPLGEMPRLLIGFREQWVSFMRLEEIMFEVRESSSASKSHKPHKSSKPFENSSMTQTPSAIKWDQIEFSYTDDYPFITNMDLDIRKGDHIALVGESGSGKSTVFKILCGFYHHTQGSYQLFGKSFEEWTIEDLRKQFALVSQSSFLFPGSIEDNVALGKLGANRQEVEEACIKANIHDFITSLPKGYDTEVGERGGKLSGGQRQRIAIARAFLKDAPILLLDEPTSAVDVETEDLIKDAISRIGKDRTVLTIAHRLSTIEDADRILVFDKGAIIEVGSHPELMKKGAYYDLYKKAGEEGGKDEQ